MNPNLVNKALSQEEQTILANIKSLTEELMSAGAGSDMGAGADETQKADLGLAGMLGQPTRKAHGEPDGDEELDADGNPIRKAKNEDIDNMDDKENAVKLEKDITSTPSDASTASSDAEDRMENVLSTLTEENVDAVEKAVARFKNRRGSGVAKSQSPIVSAIVELSKVVKDISSRQIESETAFGNLLEGLGVTKQLETAMGSQRVAKSGTPVFANDNDRLAKSLADVMTMMKGQQVEKTKDAGSNSSTVRKNMDSAVASLLVR